MTTTATTTTTTTVATEPATTAPVRTTVYTTLESPLGELLLVGTASATAKGGTALASLSLPGQKGAAVVQDGWVRAPAAFEEIAGQLVAYFRGTLTRFDIEYVAGGTDFQRRVWQALDALPYGATVTYGQIAAQVGAVGAGVRAVGTAIGRNPLLIVRPCHRVIGADGALRGYAGGLESKERLLGLEGAPAA
ncbi:methylated-DNA--[protein]-cysteine S-methyltransferase [Streptomyces sp. NPDC051569]|uniref:methylated-DNA--[protein]-cysteine S-methyltransferase n=1 Tax=Streptomyces sp. NPDC051569 TaxID=3365661 RepID=UPI0037AB1B2F